MKKFGINSLKDKAKELANNEKIKQGISVVQGITEDIKNSDIASKVVETTEQIKSSDTYNQTKDTVQQQINNVQNSEIYQKTAEKSSELSKKLQDTSKETFTNAKDKVGNMTASVMSLDTLVGQEKIIKNSNKLEFLYESKRVLKNRDPYEMIFSKAEELAKQFDGYYGEILPYGRVSAFGNDISYQTDAIAFFPVPSKNVTEMKEYGILINTDSIILKQELGKKINPFEKNKPFKNKKGFQANFLRENINELIFFDNIEEIKRIDSTIVIEYFNLSNQRKRLIIHDKYKSRHFNNLLEELLLFASKFNYGLNRDVQKLSITKSNRVLPEIKLAENKVHLLGGTIDSLNGNLGNNINHIDFAYHEALNYAQGAGYYAEYLNSELLSSITTKVQTVAKSNPGQKHGTGDNAADFKITNRFTGKTQMVQLKYKQSARQLARDIMEYDNPVMIPPDKYNETIRMLKNDPEFKGNVSEEKINSVMKGKVSYRAVNSLNESFAKKVGVDIGVSMKQAFGPAIVTTIGFAAITSGMSIYKKRGEWNKEYFTAMIKDLGKNSGKQFVKSFGISTTIGSIARISGRMKARDLAEQQIKSKNIKATKVANNFGKAATVLSISMSVVPDLTKAVNGKISKQQLGKTLITTGIGLAAGTVGMGVASLPLSIVATEATSQLYDKYVKDDVLVNYQIFKEVFIDLINIYQLPLDEINVLIEDTFANPLFNERLLELQMQCQNYHKAKYSLIYNQLTEAIEYLLSERPIMKQEDLLLLNEQIMEYENVSFA